MGLILDHSGYLLEALKLADQRRGFCSPNPAVGAVIVRENTILATGHHHAAGLPHAEVIACQNLPQNLEGVILYVTLEPCHHWGRTPPCTQLILERGIKEVYYGYQDPNPKVAGRGELFLKENGVNCQQISLPEIEIFYRSYQHWTVTQTPWVTSKLAISLDSKIADDKGKPVAITGKQAQRYTHQSRLKSDAILTSVRTIINDDPALNVRLEETVTAKPLYILDSALSLPLNARIWKTAAKITVFHSAGDQHKIHALEEKGVDCRQVSRNEAGLNLFKVIENIGQDGIHDLWVEAGGKVFSALIRQGIAHKSLIYIAPKLLGASSYPAFSEDLEAFVGTKKINWYRLGEDIMCEIDWVHNDCKRSVQELRALTVCEDQI